MQEHRLNIGSLEEYKIQIAGLGRFCSRSPRNAKANLEVALSIAQHLNKNLEAKKV